MKTDIDHPVGDLGHAEARCMAELFLLLLRGVRMVGVTVKPSFEVIGGLLWKLAALTCGAIDEGGGRHWLWGALVGRVDGDVGSGGAQGGRILRVSRGENKIRVWERPLALYP